MSVCQSVYGGSHVTTTNNALPETCSNFFTLGLPTSADIWWLLKYVWSEQMGGTHPTGMLPCVSKVNVHIWYQQKENMVH